MRPGFLDACRDEGAEVAWQPHRVRPLEGLRICVAALRGDGPREARRAGLQRFSPRSERERLAEADGGCGALPTVQKRKAPPP